MRSKLTKIFLVLFSIVMLDALLVSAQTRQPLRQKWNLLSRKLEFARELQDSFRDQSATETLNSAASKLDHARDLMAARRPLLANQLMNEAETLIDQAMRALLKEPMRLRRESLDRKIRTANDIVRKSNFQEAIDLLDKGLESRANAEQAFRAGEFQKAIRHFRKAEFQVQKSIDLVTNLDQSTAARADEEARHFEELVSQSESAISKSTAADVQKNFKLAIKLSVRAAKANHNGNHREAIDLYHQATRLLLRTRDLAEGKVDRLGIRAYEEVADLDELIETIQQRVAPVEEDERIQFFMSHIEQLQENAHQALDAQDYKLVLLNTQYARDFIERIQKKLRGGNNDMAELIDRELKQLEVDLNDLNERLVAQGVNEEANILLAYARFARTKAEALLKQQQYRFARESILVANRFAFATDRLLRKQRVDQISAETMLSKMQSAEQAIASLQSKVTTASQPEATVFLDHAQKMLDLARENLNKNYPYVANECLEASLSAIEKLQAIL